MEPDQELPRALAAAAVHFDADGQACDYSALAASRERGHLAVCLSDLETFDPKQVRIAAQMAFWINVFNAGVLRDSPELEFAADAQEVAVAIARGGFEYQGQKCSAPSRVYVPQSLWPEVRDRLVGMMREMRMGDVTDFRAFMGAVIDRKAFEKITGYIEHARQHSRIVSGGGSTKETGYFIEPTLVKALFPQDPLRRNFLRAVGQRTAMAAIPSVLPIASMQAMAQDAGKGGTLEKTKLKIGFNRITCATPLIMAHPLGL